MPHESNGGPDAPELLTRALRIQWDQTKDHWRDDQALEFERTYLMDLEGVWKTPSAPSKNSIPC